MITTYGVYGKVEFVISLIIGVKTIPIDFDGGSISSRGVIPATYTTNSPIIQKGIEASAEYKHGIIRNIKSIPEERDIIASRKMNEARENAKAAPIANETIEEESSDETSPLINEEEQVTEVKVTCMEDAVEYLKANFEGYTSSKLRSKTAIERAASEHNIVFVGL